MNYLTVTDMKVKFIFLFVINIWFSGSCMLDAQILPPDFSCVKGDTLFWNPVANSCGAFMSYDIFVASMREGPYSLLARITDQNQHKYAHINPSGLQWFYYIQSVHDCGNWMPLNSDTLDNRPPVISKISSISVVGTDVLVTWEPSPSPETEAYIVYRVTNVGTVPIDTVFGATSYLDQSVDGSKKSETYYVLALDPCGNTSLFDLPHSTLFLEASTTACTQQINLTWNAYDGEPGSVISQEIWVGADGNSPVPVDTIAGSMTSYDIRDVQDGVAYCVFVKLINSTENFSATSNMVCLSPQVVQPIKTLYLKNLDVQSAVNVKVEWIWNDDAYLQSATLRANTTSSSIDVSGGLVRDNSQISNSVSANEGVISFSVEATDDCGAQVISTIGKQIYLTVRPGSGLENILSWTPLEIENLQVQSYEVYSRKGNQTSLIQQLNSDEFGFTDLLDANEGNEQEKCYFVRANSELTHPSGNVEKIISNSNLVCQIQDVRIFLPNAFAPRGKNQSFKPIVAFGRPKTYSMQIFNRWGAEVFRSDNIETGWNGKRANRDAPAGVYTYLIQIGNQNGQTDRLTGTVFLLR